MRNYAGFALREKGKFISPQVTFGSSDTTAYTSAPSLYGHIPDIRLGSDPYRSMSDWPDRISKKSPSYSISQDTGEGITAHEMYHVARGVSSMSPLLDAALSPAIYKSSGDYSSAKPSDVITVSKEIYQVDDIEEVAKIYEG